MTRPRATPSHSPRSTSSASRRVAAPSSVAKHAPALAQHSEHLAGGARSGFDQRRYPLRERFAA
jgi:hypothetical protein